MASAKPSAIPGSFSGRMPKAAAPAHPPTPESTAIYCLPSGPRYVIGWPIMPDPARNDQSSSPVRACTAFTMRSMVP